MRLSMSWLLWGPRTGRLWLDTLIADIVATLVVFGFSRVYRNSSFYDAYWSVIPPLLFGYWWWQGPVGTDGPGALRCWLLAVVIGYWAVRLTGNCDNMEERAKAISESLRDAFKK